ncbi:hypothetical protein [Streptomyces sp. A5-4]|uniref:hypothetical protein n=1 Tax=Streptomyces sp. A5-4 TaxID=3384771 RepID=UPI003DA99ACD
MRGQGGGVGAGRHCLTALAGSAPERTSTAGTSWTCSRGWPTSRSWWWTAAATGRYRLLETIRQYGQQRLHEQGGATELFVQHSDHYRALAGQAAAQWCGPREVEWLSRQRTELPNLRAALDFCATRPDRAGIGLEIAVNVTRTRCWFFRSTLGEGRHWLERFLALAPEAPPALMAGAVAMKAWIALCQGDRPVAEVFLAECRSMARLFGDGGPPPPVVFIEGAHAMLVRGDPVAVPLLAEARSRFREAGHHGDAHMATMLWAMAAAFLGDGPTACAARDVYVAEAEASGGEWARTWAQWCRGLTELRHGDPALARPPLRESLERQHAIGDRWGPAWGLEALAWAAAGTGRHGQAAGLLGAAHRLRQDSGIALIGLHPFHDAHAEAECRVRAVLGPHVYAAAWARGAAAQDSVRLALDLSS